MMKIIHGDNQIESREYLNKYKEQARLKGVEVVTLLAKKADLSEVIQAVESGGLFGDLRLVVIEELFSGLTSSSKKAVIEYLKKESPEMVVIWEPKPVDGRKLKGVKAEIKEFKVNSKIFKFLESVAPGGQRAFMPLWEELSSNEPAELIFFMLLRQTRQLISILSDPTSFRGPSWLTGKLKKQADAFGMEGLLRFHAEMYRLEEETKLGKSNLPLATRMELLLLSI